MPIILDGLVKSAERKKQYRPLSSLEGQTPLTPNRRHRLQSIPGRTPLAGRGDAGVMSIRMASAPTEGLPHGYTVPAGLYDEMISAGAVRPHWRALIQGLDALGVGELTRRWEEARHLIRENGVTYNVYGDPRGMDRPWQLDPVPLLISSPEARSIESGLVQRARLLERILADLYGPQTILREGLLPPELVFGHPRFLRPCHGVAVPAGRHLILYAADIGRGPEGSVWVLGDRTQAPSGTGYALENRIVLSRMLPDLFRDCHVQRLALFFRAFRDAIKALAPHNRDNPRIVLLTPGPFNETYFEHAYLARYLGFTLVEGGDLTVRDSRVFLKVLGGLQPVDVIHRRLDDDFCDPLELRGDSFLGVPGLVQAVRAGNVAVANPLGSGLVETPALPTFLPALCRRLLGEELRLPSVPTWWCGDPAGLSHVLANLPRLVVKPTFVPARRDPIFGERLSAAERQALADRIRANPRAYVGQEQLPLSTAPVLAGDHLRPCRLVIRAYVSAKDDGFAVMPGGLTRVTASADAMVASMQSGGGSKDTWVLSSGPVSTFSLLSTVVRPVELSRGGSDLPSRAADNLYWLGRYGERAEGTVRLLRGVAGPPDGKPRPGRGAGTAEAAAGADIAYEIAPRLRRRRRAGAAGGAGKGSPLADLRPAAVGRPGGHPASAAPRRRHGARPHLGGHVARAQRPGTGGAGRRPADLERYFGPSEPIGGDAGGVRRPDDGEHDARPGVALPRHRPPAGACPANARPAAFRPGDRRQRGRPAARKPPRSRRQLHDLSPPLSQQPANGPGARSASGRRDQPAFAGVPAVRPGRPRRGSAARPGPGRASARSSTSCWRPGRRCGWPTWTCWPGPTPTADGRSWTRCWPGWRRTCRACPTSSPAAISAICRSPATWRPLVPDPSSHDLQRHAHHHLCLQPAGVALPQPRPPHAAHHLPADVHRDFPGNCAEAGRRERPRRFLRQHRPFPHHSGAA